MEIIVFLIHAYLYLSIFEELAEKSNCRYKWTAVLFLGIIKYIVESVIYTKNLFPLILCTLLVLYGKCIQRNYSYLQNLKYALITYGIDLALSIIMGSAFGIIGVVFKVGGRNWTTVSTAIGRIIFIIVLSKKKTKVDYFKQTWVLHIGAIATIVLAFSEQIIRLGYATENYGFLDIALSCSYLVALFTTLWLIDHHKMLKIQNEYALDNQQMSQKLHRSKEVLPLLASYVTSMDVTPDEKMRQKLQDVCHDYGRELCGSQMDVALFNTTGVGLLDLMLQNKVSECRNRNIEMEVFVNTEIDEDMEELHISDGELIRMMGDLLRNAIHAVEAAGASNGMILALVARNAYGHVELQVHDSGVPFPKEIMDNIGKRGNTTWGTGNGIADLIVSLRRVRASFDIIPVPDPDDIFTKEVCIRFDGKGTVMSEVPLISCEGSVETIQPAPI